MQHRVAKLMSENSDQCLKIAGDLGVVADNLAIVGGTISARRLPRAGSSPRPDARHAHQSPHPVCVVRRLRCPVSATGRVAKIRRPHARAQTARTSENRRALDISMRMSSMRSRRRDCRATIPMQTVATRRRRHLSSAWKTRTCSEQEIALRHRQHRRRLAGQQFAVGAHLVGLRIDLDMRRQASLWTIDALEMPPRVFLTATHAPWRRRACRRDRHRATPATRR